MSKEENKKGYKPLSDDQSVEEYFYKKDQELVAKMREKADAERLERERQAAKELHWMRCPKCGGPMQEIEQFNIKLDQCTHCSGIYFDAGELDILLRMQNKDTFLSKLIRKFK